MKTLEELSIHAWIQKNRIKTESGAPIDFRNHLFLFDIYSDFSPKQVILKAAQIGFSTLAILKSLYVAKQRGLDLIYTLPTSGDASDFVSGKVNRIIANNPVLQDYVQYNDSVEQKRVGNNVIYYRGTWTDRVSIMVSSDLNIYDEEDRSKQDSIQQYSSRLQHSSYKGEWHFSNPSVEGNGVSRYWTASTQSHWFIKCNHCFKRQYLSWPESIDRERQVFICRYCNEELSSDARRVGKWVKKVKNADYQGYWINLLMCPWVTASEIIKYYETKSKEFFWNFVLGLPYVGEGNTVSPNIIFANCTERINSQERVIIGCDSGLTKHFVLGNGQGIFYYGKTDTWKDIESLLKKYERSIAVIDALPDLTEPRKLREQYPGRVFLCHYARDRKTMNFIRWGINNEYGNVVVDRNRMMQLVIDEFADMRIPLQGTRDDWSEYYSHWATLYRMTELDVLGVPVSKWETRDGMDHWCHATLYWRVGMDKFGNEGGDLLGTTDILQGIPIAPTVSAEDTVPNMSKPKYYGED